MLKRTVAIVLLLSGLMANAFAQAQEKPADRALAWFAQIEERDFADYLKRVRLPKVSETFKAQVLANLARGKEVKPSTSRQAELATLGPVLRYHEREAVIEIKVVALDRVFVGLQGRSALLISEKALQLLTTGELQATAAHELAHEYFWGEYQEARQRKQYDRMREIELLCDGIAVITLERLGLDPAHLISGLQKIRLINSRVEELDKDTHPLPDERFKFIRALAKLVKVRDAAVPSS